MKVHEIPEVVMGGLRSRNLCVRLRLDGVNNVRELDTLLDKEDGNIVANNVPVALIGVELDSKAADVSNGVGTTSTTLDCREPKEYGRGTRGIGEHTS
jgi:hypothetical protein